MGLFDIFKKKKLEDGLEKTRTGFFQQIVNTLTNSQIDDDLYNELEEQLILADVGPDCAVRLVDELRDTVERDHLKTGEQALKALREIIRLEMSPTDDMDLSGNPAVILVIGVNGVGKTTTIGKLAASYTAQGMRVMLSAADTFRAAAADQLEIWAQRAGADIVRHGEGADPAAVVFDSIAAAKARNCDVIIVDTAGRLHNKANLMNELNKIDRVITRELPDSSRETLLVLDATTGQNAVSQAEQFNKVAKLTGIVLTKLDGTAKGGIVVAISAGLGVPVKYVGVGEGIDDLMPFERAAFVEALLPTEELDETDEIEEEPEGEEN